MIERKWVRFRRLPLPARVAAWILLAPFLAALWLWRAPRAQVAARIGAVALVVLFTPVYVALATGAEPSSPASGGRSGRTDAEMVRPTSSPMPPIAEGSVPVAPEVSPVPTPSPSAVQPAPSPAPTATQPTARSSTAPRETAPQQRPSSVPTRGPSSPPTTGGCDPSYPGVCLQMGAPDLDCPEIGLTNVEVRWDVPNPDPHGFDADKDGVGCEKR
jgi:hypothetical protein